MCDFWVRVRLNKMSVEDIKLAIERWLKENSAEQYCVDLDLLIGRYWKTVGLHDLTRLQIEDPQLHSKIICVEDRVRREHQDRHHCRE